MFVSVIIPVYNGGETFRRCLAALQQTLYKQWELIVVDDGSTDQSLAIAYSYGAQVIHSLPSRSGPAQARNLGARMAQGQLLFFMDADVLVQPGAIGHAVAIMQADPTLAACFGSYDDTPTEPNFLSQYRNLLHHYVHQNSHLEASTFWSGCGAIRRDIFWEVGGFNTVDFPRPSIEDIELGYRLRAAGRRIRLEKLLQVRHMKRWTVWQMLLTDVRDRALPWTRLIVQAGAVPNDLNLQTTPRLSTAVVFLSVGLLLIAPFAPWVTAGLPLAVVALLLLNRDFYTFLWRQRGPAFTLLALPWHWFYFLYSGLSFLAGAIWYGMLGMNRRISAPNPALWQ